MAESDSNRPGAAEPQLTLTGVGVRFGDSTKLREVNLSVARGGSLALFGPNGHGKTTLLRAISGLVSLSAGSIQLDGHELSGKSPRAIVSLGVSHVPQGSILFPQLSVAELLELGAQSRRARERKEQSRELVFSLFPRLEDRRRQTCGTLSGGERQMAAIGMGIMAAPEVLLLDEPTLGLAPLVRTEIAAAIKGLRESGMTLVVADGDVDFLFDLSDDYAVIQDGAVARIGRSADRPDDSDIIADYFGADPA